MNNKSLDLLANIQALHKKFGARLNTREKWVVAYWQQIDMITVTDGKISVDDIINKATNPSHILDTLELYRITRQMG